MTYDLGSTGLQILLAYAFGFGAIAQLIVGTDRSRWLWLLVAVGWFVGGLFASEVLFAKATVDEIQPIIDGLAYDEALLGGLLGGLIVTVATWFFSGSVPRAATPQHPRSAAPLA